MEMISCPGCGDPRAVDIQQSPAGTGGAWAVSCGSCSHRWDLED